MKSDRVIETGDKSVSPGSEGSNPTSRRIGSAAEARAWLEAIRAAESAPAGSYRQLEEWLRRYRRRTRGLPYVQLVADDLVSALEQGTLEFVGIVFAPARAPVADVFVIWGTLALSNGRLTLGELAIAPYTPGESTLTGESLRRISLSTIIARAHAEIASRADLATIARRYHWANAPNNQEHEALTQLTKRAAAGRPNRGRPSLGDAHYARIARAYLQKQAEGHGRGILQALAQQEGRPHQTVRDWVAGARKRGFLTPGTQGRAGALPGPRLTELNPKTRTRRKRQG